MFTPGAIKSSLSVSGFNPLGPLAENEATTGAGLIPSIVPLKLMVAVGLGICSINVKALDLEQNYELAKVKIGDEDPKKEKVEIEVERRGKKTSDESDVSGWSRSDVSVDARNIGWGRWYSLRELEDVTRGFRKKM
ncbi:hypothetical protein K1719_006058 [Acacia pycnantha]|nr:hypothetical protein K1719_006058 [Acacia pycnantha]